LSKFVASYPYTDENGEVLYTINRTVDKIFIPTVSSADVVYSDIERVPYNLPGIYKAIDSGEPVWVVEGEKSADLLISLGLAATCSAGGAAWVWPNKWSGFFSGALQVFVCADNDKPGRDAAERRAKVISFQCDDVRVIYFDELEEKQDVWDWLQSHETDELWRKAEMAEKYSLIKSPIKLDTEKNIISYLLRPTYDKSYIFDNVAVEDFSDVFWRAAYHQTHVCYQLGLNPDPPSLAARMIESGSMMNQVDIERKLWDALDNPSALDDAYRTWVDDIISASTRRSVETAVKRVVGCIQSGSSSDSIVKCWEDAGKGIRSVVTAADPAPDFDDFMSIEESYNWMIPKLLEWRDRIVISGPEGQGKSTLTRQWAVMCAAGISWFNHGQRFDPLRTLIIDRENSPNQVRRGLRRIGDTADRLVGKAWHSNLMIDASPSAVNILEAGDRRLIESKIVANRPDFVVFAPMYKLFQDSDGRNQEQNAQTFVKIIDDWREKYGISVLMEGHAPHGDPGSREYRITGSSVFRRWSEIGRGLTPSDRPNYFEFKKFRGDRNGEEIYVPKFLFWNPDRDGGWPWLHCDDEDDY